MKYRLIVQPNVAAEIEQAALWIYQDSPARSVTWADGIHDAMASLQEFPERFPLAPESPAFKEPVRQLVYKSHRVLFVVRTDTVRVVHIRHTAMRPLDDS